MLKKNYTIFYLYLIYSIVLLVGFLNNTTFFQHFSEIIIPITVTYWLLQYKVKDTNINLLISLVVSHIFIGFDGFKLLQNTISNNLNINIFYIKPLILLILFSISLKLYKFNRNIMIFSLLLGLNLLYQSIIIYSLYGTFSVKEQLYAHIVENNINPIQCNTEINCIKAENKEKLINEIELYIKKFQNENLILPSKTFELLAQEIRNTEQGTGYLNWYNPTRINLDIHNEFNGLFIFNVDNGYLIYDSSDFDDVVEKNIIANKNFIGLVTIIWLVGLVLLNIMHSYFRGRKKQ